MKIMITGASSGIAFLAGITLKDRGHNVIMTTHTKKQKESLERRLKKINMTEIQVCKLDITNPIDRESIFPLLKYVDVLINHAGIGIGGSLVDLPIEKVKENFEVNFFSSFQLAQMYLSQRLDHLQKSRILFTSSIAATIPFEFLGSYCSSKASISMMARCLKKELAIIDKQVEICLIEPGAYHTGFNQVMIDLIPSCIKPNSPFYPIKNEIHQRLQTKFNLLEKKNLESIVCQVIQAVEQKKPRFIYSAPLTQQIAKKLYQIFIA